MEKILLMGRGLRPEEVSLMQRGRFAPAGGGERASGGALSLQKESAERTV
jgi:hypothetical protein